MIGELARPVTRQRATIVPDPYQPRGEGSLDWSSPDELRLCLLFAPATSSSPLDPDRSPGVAGAAFYGEDPHVDVLDGDRLVQTDGSVWRVDGPPQRWDACGTDWPGGVVIPAERVTEKAG